MVDKIDAQELQLRIESLIHLTGGRTMLQKKSTIEDDLDHLRLYIEYMIFDLEATRRELKASGK